MAKKIVKKLIGCVSVDAGILWVGDPCYIHHDGKEKPPKEWGKNWPEFLHILREKEKDKYPTMAQFNHDAGHSGLGVCVSTGYGDGCYPVVAEIKDCGEFGQRIKSITVKFL